MKGSKQEKQNEFYELAQYKLPHSLLLRKVILCKSRPHKQNQIGADYAVRKYQTLSLI